MAKVLLVAEPDTRGALQAALEALRLEVQACSPKEAAARAPGADVIAVGGFPDDATVPRFVGHLLASLETGCPPVVCQVTAKAAARDAALIAGAADVAFDSDADHFASRVSAVASRWARGARQAPINGSIRAQSGRASLTLKVTAVDVTGLGLATTAGLSPRQLVRVQVPLASGHLVAWGRVAQSEGVAGIRFLGLSAADRARLAEAVESAAVESAAVESEAVESAAVESEAVESAAVESAPAVESAAVESAAVESAPAVERARAPLHPGPPPSAPSLPAADGAPRRADPVAPVGPQRTEPPTPPAEKPAADQVAPSDAWPAAAPAEAKPAADALSSAIGDALDDALSAGSEVEALASIPEGGIVRRWPETAWETDACIEVLQGGASVGLVSDVDRAPSGETVLAFLRTVTPLERRAFDAAPPAELPPAPLAARCLALRLRCFALVEDARAQPEDGAGWVVDHAPLLALKAEADLARAELQKLADALMAEGETVRLRDVTGFANALHRAYTDVTAQVARLKGEAVTRDRAVLLDVAESDPTAVAAGRAKPTKTGQKKEARTLSSRDFRKLTPQQRARRRLIGWSVVLVTAVALRVVLWPEGVKTVGTGELRAVPGVVEVKLPPAGPAGQRPQAAAVTVIGTWRADDAEAMEKLKAFLRGKGAKRFVVLDGTGSLLATGGTGAADKVVVTESPSP